MPKSLFLISPPSSTPSRVRTAETREAVPADAGRDRALLDEDELGRPDHRGAEEHRQPLDSAARGPHSRSRGAEAGR